MAAEVPELWLAGVGLAVTLAVLGALVCWTAEEWERHAPGERPPPPPDAGPDRPGAE